MRIIIIGGGPGGVAAAVRAAQLDAHVTVVESENLGGVCMNLGCVPLRVLGSAAETAAVVGSADKYGLVSVVPRLNGESLALRVKDTVNTMRMGTEALLRSYNVTVIRGKGCLTASGGVRVGTEVLSADAVILALGSDWVRPGFRGAELDGVITPEEIFSDSKVPDRILVLGGRPWAVELAAFCARFDAAVTLLTDGDFLPAIDRQVSNRLRAAIKESGVEILQRAVLESVRRQGGCLVATVKTKDETLRREFDRVMCTDRAPRLVGSGLKEAGVVVDSGAVKVDESLRTTHPKVLAIGDLTGEPLLSHKASAQGIVAAEVAIGRKRTFSDRAIPTVVYTLPEAAAVGLTEKEAKARGYDIVIGEMPLEVNARAMAELSGRGFVKLICEAQHKAILGVHLLGNQSAELIHTAALAIQLEATAEELADLVAAHPTYGESLVDAARAVLDGPIYMLRQKG